MEVLSLLLIPLFAATWGWHMFAVVRGASASERVRQPFRRVVDASFHVLMSVAMLGMLWPGLAPETGSAVTLVQIAVFGGGALWFLLTSATVRPRWFDATAMAAMVWMLIMMRQAGTDGGRNTTPAGATGQLPNAGHAGHAGHAGSLGHQAETVVGLSWTGVVTVMLMGLLVLGVAHTLRRWRSTRPSAPDSLPGSMSEGLVGAVMGAGMAVSLLVME